MLIKYWEAAYNAEYGIAIPTDNRGLLRQHLYRARAEFQDPRFDEIVMIIPEKEDEIWLVHKDADSSGTPDQSNVEPFRR